jgi:hypothetical protein
MHICVFVLLTPDGDPLFSLLQVCLVSCIVLV